jgi:BirA family biotin operon repressor/biotin-[acetyl-CoA-carboxylase] ligase
LPSGYFASRFPFFETKRGNVLTEVVSAEADLPLLRLMADGAWHGLEGLARALAKPADQIIPQLHALEGYGLQVEIGPAQAYRLTSPLEFLERERIVSALTPEARACLTCIEVLFQTGSTNQVLLDRIPPGGIHRQVCLAEYQSAGRGRQGRHWRMPLGAGIGLSLGWRFDVSTEVLMSLGLACGVGIIRALRRLGLGGAGLKWPNDIYWSDRKLGGVLVEARWESTGSAQVVMGVGLNVAFPPEGSDAIDQPWVDLVSALGQPVSRNRVAAALISDLALAASVFEGGGFGNFVEEWRSYDCLRRRRVHVSAPGTEVVGEVLGIDEQGALLLEVNGEIQRYLSGEVSLRLPP